MSFKPLLEWLCNKVEPTISPEQIFNLGCCYDEINKQFESFALPYNLEFNPPEVQRQAVEKFMADNPDFVISEYITKTLALVVPLRAKPIAWFWKMFTYGTDCHCCWAWRVIALSGVSFVAGLFLGKMS